MALEEKVKGEKILWAERENKNMNPLLFFQLHFDPKTTRGRLARQDNALYRFLLRGKRLDDAIPCCDEEMSKHMKLLRRLSGKRSRFGNDPFAYYQERYAGMPPGELSKKDSYLYRCLARNGLIGKLPRKKAKPRDFGSDPLVYCHAHYPGITRGQLRDNDMNLYGRIRKDGLLDALPLASRFGDDPLAYYKGHYGGLTRWQLGKIDNGLYKRLRRERLLNLIPCQRRINVDNPLAYCNEHYPFFTRRQLQKGDPSIYECIRKAKLLHRVPKEKPNCSEELLWLYRNCMDFT